MAMRVEQKMVDKRGYTRSGSGSGSRPHTSKQSVGEVDAIANPTELFRRINSGDWDGALNTVHGKPAEASIWVSRRNKNGDGGLAWKYLPLHLICLQQRPPMDLLLALLKSYPKGASLHTPHDGNLPIHYVCESGCDDERVFAALLKSFPGALEVKNGKEKTPLLMCHPRSRGVLMNVLRQRKPLPFNDGKVRGKDSSLDQLGSSEKRHGHKNKDRRNKSRKKERRSDVDTTWKDNSAPMDDPRQPPQQQRRPPKTTPARYTRHRSTFDDNPVDEAFGDGCEVETPRASNNCYTGFYPGREKTAVAKDEGPSSSFSNSTSTPDDSDTASYISSKTTELVSSALNYFVPSATQGGSSQQQEEDKQKGGNDDTPVMDQVRDLTKENEAQKKTIEELAKQLDRLNSSNEANTENSRLCERILAKAEADNVAFRSQIKKLQDEKDKIKKAVKSKEKDSQQSMERLRKVISDQGSSMKIDVFYNDGSTYRSTDSRSEEVVEALRTLLSHMDERNGNLQVRVGEIEEDLSKSEVNLKTLQSKNQILERGRETAVKERHEAERKATLLEEEKQKAEKSVSQLKERVSTLTVINQSLQEQVDTMSNSQVTQENAKFKMELANLNAELLRVKEEQESEADIKYKHQIDETEEKIECLLEQNRSLKDTILVNNEKYSEKIQDLSEQYSSLERANEDLRQSLASRLSDESRRASMRVNLDEEGDKLLYEV